MKIIAIDPGTKYIGIAICDPTGTLAYPLDRISHRSYVEDAQFIIEKAKENQVDLILIGQSFNDNGNPNFAGRISIRLAGAITNKTGIPVLLWDESFTTQEAREARLIIGTKRKKRTGHLDSLAATMLLQSYLDRNK